MTTTKNVSRGIIACLFVSSILLLNSGCSVISQYPHTSALAPVGAILGGAAGYAIGRSAQSTAMGAAAGAAIGGGSGLAVDKKQHAKKFVDCPNCSAEIHSQNLQVGQRSVCPACKERFVVREVEKESPDE